MERKISLADLQKTVDNAYEQFKSLKEGEVDARVKNADPKSFGIAVVLTDGTVIKKADTDTKFALGDIAKVPVQTVLATQNTAEEIVKKSGSCCRCAGKPAGVKGEKLPVNKHALRAVSAIEPTGDSDGKYDLILNTLISMAGDAPVFNDDLYKELSKEAADANVEDELAKMGYELYDDTQISINVYNKLRSLEVNAEQLATIGATIAADGVNPKNNQIVFDGSKASTIVTLMATVGNHRRQRADLMKIGLPTRHSFAGGILAVLPGFGAIAAYSPELCEKCHESAKAKKAIEYIANTLGLNIFSSARVEVVK